MAMTDREYLIDTHGKVSVLVAQMANLEQRLEAVERDVSQHKSLLNHVRGAWVLAAAMIAWVGWPKLVSMIRHE